MKNCDLKYVMELIVLYAVLSYFGSLDTAAIGDCPPGQVFHINPENNKGLCCIPLRIQRGYEAVPCSVDGTEDGFQKCQNGTHQPDETSSSHMPECIVDPQCTNEGMKRDYRCIDEYCWPVCICSLEHGKCGLNPFDCTDINKITCPSTVLPNCSCAPPDITSTLPASSSSTVKPISLESSVPTPTNESWIDSTKIIDKFDTTEDGTDKQNKWIIPVSFGCAFLVVVVVVVLCIYYRRRKDNILMQNGDICCIMDYILCLLGMALLLHCEGIYAGKFTSRNTKCRGDSECGTHGYTYWWCYVDDDNRWEYCCSNSCDFHGASYKWCNSGSTWDYCHEISYDTDNGQRCDPEHPCGGHFYPKSIPFACWCYTDLKTKAWASCSPPSDPDCNKDEEDYD